MNIAESTIVNLYETNCVEIEDIQQSLEIPLAYVLDVLERKSPKYRALAKSNGKTLFMGDVVQAPDPNGVELPNGEKAMTALPQQAVDEDIPDRLFARLREEAFTLALNPAENSFLRANMIKFLWARKRPEGVSPVNINVNNINLALERAREIRKAKLSPSMEIES